MLFTHSNLRQHRTWGSNDHDQNRLANHNCGEEDETFGPEALVVEINVLVLISEEVVEVLADIRALTIEELAGGTQSTMGRRATVVQPRYRRGAAGDVPHVSDRRGYAERLLPA